jgi:hypothetical protein
MDTDNHNDDDEPERIFWGGLFSQDKNMGSRVQCAQGKSGGNVTAGKSHNVNFNFTNQSKVH